MASSGTHRQISQLLQQGQENAVIYLRRRSVEQRLNILEENLLFASLHQLKDILE